MSISTDMWDRPLYPGDDVVVYLPSGAERDGRYVEARDGRAVVALDGRAGTRLYPFGWLSAWGD